jgi:BASS family bile acid:Na+ symporter
MDLDAVQINFSENSRHLMNVLLAFIMFGVSLDIKWLHFRDLWKSPKSALTGIFSQFIFLPLITLGLVYLLKPHPSLALGMFLLAAVPGGNISNFMSHLARGNTALSISLTAFSSLASIIMTPLNFAFWGSLYPETRIIIREIHLDPIEVFEIISLLLIIPLILGVFFSSRFPNTTEKIKKPIKNLSIIIFLAFVVVAFQANFNIFLQVIKYIALYVAIHHTTALLSGYGLASLTRLPGADRRTIAIETSIQNSGLALILVFNFFDGLGGMALMAAWWSIWHISMGLFVSTVWSKFPPRTRGIFE